MSYREPNASSPRWNNSDWRTLQAGEYVLGTLQGRTLDEFLDRLQHDRNLRQEILLWEERLQPMANAVEAVEPPTSVWRSIVNRLSREQRQNTSHKDLSIARQKRALKMRKQIDTWRAATAVACAACLATLSMLWFQQANRPIAFDSISVVSGESGPLWVVDASIDSKVLKITAIAPPQIASNKVHQLWMIKPDNTGVVSLGLLPQDGKTSIIIDGSDIDASAVALAVSLENSGGSPEPAPVGPVLYQGEFSVVQPEL